MHDGTWTLADCPPGAQAELVRALGVSAVTAAVLARRGYVDPAEAGRFLDGEQPPHDPFLLGDMETACERIRATIAAGKPICVHGDYDVDGIAATALAVLLLRELGADVDWHLPSRFDEGYGVSRATLARIGTLKTSSGSPSATMRPYSKTITRSPSVIASSRLCVT